jgi:hypothetical protein
MKTFAIHNLAPIDVQDAPIIGLGEEAMVPCCLDVKVGGPPLRDIFQESISKMHLQ